MNNLYDYIQIDSLVCEIYNEDLEILAENFDEFAKIKKANNNIQIIEDIIEDIKEYSILLSYPNPEKEISWAFNSLFIKFAFLITLKQDLINFSNHFKKIKTDKNLTDIISNNFIDFLFSKSDELILDFKNLLKENKFSSIRRGLNFKIVKTMNDFLKTEDLEEKINIWFELEDILDCELNLTDQDVEIFKNNNKDLTTFLEEWLFLNISLNTTRNVMHAFVKRTNNRIR